MGNPRDVNDVHQFHARAGLLHGSAPEVCARRVRVTPGPSGLGGDPASRCAPGPRLAAKLVATQARERAMSRNNSERIRQAIADLIERAPEVGPGTLPDWQEEGRAILRAGFGQDDDILARFNVISYVPHSLSRGSMGGGAAGNARRSGVRRAVPGLHRVRGGKRVVHKRTSGRDVIRAGVRDADTEPARTWRRTRRARASRVACLTEPPRPMDRRRAAGHQGLTSWSEPVRGMLALEAVSPRRSLSAEQVFGTLGVARGASDGKSEGGVQMEAGCS